MRALASKQMQKDIMAARKCRQNAGNVQLQQNGKTEVIELKTYILYFIV